MTDYDAYTEAQKSMNKPSFKIWNQVQPFHVVLLFALLFIGIKIVEGNKDNKIIWALVIGGGVLYLFSLTKGGEKKIIPRHLAEQIAFNDLKNEIGPNKCYPLGTEIHPTSYFKDQSWDAGDGPKLFKYNIGFILKEPTKAQIDIIYQMNPFNGECKGIVEALTGFTGEDIKDIQQIFPEKMVKETKE